MKEAPLVRMDKHAQISDKAAPLDVPPQGVGGYDENWYPVLLSSELEVGQTKSVEFLSDLVTVFRTESGVAQAVTPYCSHMGADLGLGEVVGETVQCAFHHWCYDKKGSCVYVPAAPELPIPSTAHVFAYPTVEQWGIIWVYNGTTPRYEVPCPPLVKPTDSLYTTFGARDHATKGDPWLHTVNIVDLQHIVYLHGAADFPVQVDQPLRMTETELQYDFDLEFMGNSHAYHGLIGSNTVVASIWSKDDNTLLWAWMMPMLALPNGRSKAFRVGMAPKVTGDADEAAQMEVFFEKMTAEGTRVREEDEMLVDTIRPHPRNLIPGPDDYLAQTLQWFKNYPRQDPSLIYR
jgi:phenylpropionate dioxygenase-like ring-hydroxylating dioxygenase large terminal subunit